MKLITLLLILILCNYCVNGRRHRTKNKHFKKRKLKVNVHNNCSRDINAIIDITNKLINQQNLYIYKSILDLFMKEYYIRKYTYDKLQYKIMQKSKNILDNVSTLTKDNIGFIHNFNNNNLN